MFSIHESNAYFSTPNIHSIICLQQINFGFTELKLKNEIRHREERKKKPSVGRWIDVINEIYTQQKKQIICINSPVQITIAMCQYPCVCVRSIDYAAVEYTHSPDSRIVPINKCVWNKYTTTKNSHVNFLEHRREPPPPRATTDQRKNVNIQSPSSSFSFVRSFAGSFIWCSYTCDPILMNQPILARTRDTIRTRSGVRCGAHRELKNE